MKILLSTILLFIPLSVSADLVCPSLGGCPIIWETGICVGCIEKEVIVKKVVEETRVVNTLALGNVDNTNPHYKSYYDPNYEPEKKVVSNLSLDNGGNIQRGIPRVVNILTDPIHGRVRHAIRLVEERKVARCVSGCRSSRWATLNLRGEGRLWKHKQR
jgi:hypothetical protein